MNKKRGVSALIATVLLISITIAAFFIVSTGYQNLIVEKQKQISIELAKIHCPEEFDFTIDSCWTEGWTDGSIKYGVMCWIIDNKFATISSNTEVLLTSGGKSIRRPYSIPFEEVPFGGSKEDCFSYQEQDLGTLKIERIKLIPLLEVVEEGKTRPTRVECDNYKDFKVDYCTDSDLNGYKGSGALTIEEGQYQQMIAARAAKAAQAP